jgi:hypothetical protein
MSLIKGRFKPIWAHYWLFEELYAQSMKSRKFGTIGKYLDTFPTLLDNVWNIHQISAVFSILRLKRLTYFFHFRWSP